jgi:4-diphosphocytidyl-2-C-methyl-D-erythritol kinase
MVLKSYAKINLTLLVNKRLKSGLHNIQSIYCLIDLHDKIFLKKIRNKNFDQVSFAGPFSKDINKSNNSVKKVLSVMRKNKIINDYYAVKVIKKIPVFAGLGGGTSNAATLLKHLTKKSLNKKTLSKITKDVGSDLKLFFHNQGHQKNLRSVIKLNKKYNFHFLLIFPKIKSSTKSVYAKVKNYSKLKKPFNKSFAFRKNFIELLINSKNDLQSIVEKKHKILGKILQNINEFKGCYFSRMTGSGSTCYGLFVNKNSSLVALKKLRKKYPKFWFSIAKTI